MNTELVSTFLQIVKYRQISLAADSLFITQAAVSNRLRKLENYLGVKLVNRVKGRGTITLTDEGERLVPIAQRYLEIVQKASNIKNFARYDHLTVAVDNDINTVYLSPIIPKLMMSNPELRLTILSRPSSKIADMVKNNDADLGFSLFPNHDPALVNKKCFSDNLTLVTGQQSDIPLRVSTDDLNRQKEIYCPYDDNYAEWRKVCWGEEATPYLQSDSISSILPNLLNDGYWSIVPAKMAALYHSQMRICKLVELNCKLNIYSFTLLDNPHQGVIQKVISGLSFHNKQKD